jgi:hypothetical protein
LYCTKGNRFAPDAVQIALLVDAAAVAQLQNKTAIPMDNKPPTIVFLIFAPSR